MLEQYFEKPATVDRVRGSWIGAEIERYVAWLAEPGYRPRVVFRCVPQLVAFGEFARRRGAAQRRVQPFLVTLTEHSEAFPLFQHDSVEFLYALEGSILYRYGLHTYDLAPGDSLMFDGGIPHGPERLDVLPARFLSITVEIDSGQYPGER